MAGQLSVHITSLLACLSQDQGNFWPIQSSYVDFVDLWGGDLGSCSLLCWLLLLRVADGGCVDLEVHLSTAFSFRLWRLLCLISLRFCRRHCQRCSLGLWLLLLSCH